MLEPWKDNGIGGVLFGGIILFIGGGSCNMVHLRSSLLLIKKTFFIIFNPSN